MKILITGAGGFIGTALCSQLPSAGNTVIGVDITRGLDKATNVIWEKADLTDSDAIVAICAKHSPDVVIHCAGIAHQKMGAVDSAAYMMVNSEATANLAKAAVKSNPDVCFVFLSSVSVYGEGPQMASRKGAKAQRRERDLHINGTKINNDDGVGEDGECWPSSDYAVSKLDAERRLGALADEGTLRNLVILRLAPVYDREWSLNLDRRVFAPGKLTYLRFGSGLQRMSALARPNLVDFIELISRKKAQNTQEFKEQKELVSSIQAKGMNIINVSDSEPYEFNRIINVFKKSGIHPNRPVISVPLSPVWFATRFAGAFFSKKKSWFHSCYDKLASDLVFDNRRILETGFVPRHSLETIFDPQIAQISAD